MDTNFDTIIVTNVENCELKRLLLTILHTVLCCLLYLEFIPINIILYYNSNYIGFIPIAYSTNNAQWVFY